MIDFHFILLALHIFTGLLSFFCGLIVFKKLEGGWPFSIYVWSMLAMSATLVGSVIWNWYHSNVFTQIVYGIICIGMFYANFRSFEARHKEAYRYSTWRLDFVIDIGVTLIVLFCALVILAAIDLVLPIWLVVLIVAATILVGRKAIQMRRDNYIAKRSDRRPSK